LDTNNNNNNSLLQEVDVTETATYAVHSLEEGGREIEEEEVGKMIEIQIAVQLQFIIDTTCKLELAHILPVHVADDPDYQIH